MNWLPEKVICIKTHSLGYVLQGHVYTIHGVVVCGCGNTHVDVGIPLPPPYNCFQCSHCKHLTMRPQNAWFNHKLFRPFDELDATLEEIEKDATLEPIEA